MRGRPKRKRLIKFFPEITHFKPVGIPSRNLPEVVLSLDETEALRLAELENLDQEAAAKKMKISRVTFLRILHSSHKKIAESLIYGKSLKLRGGDYIMPNLDGTGPLGQGPKTGQGRGRNIGRRGMGGTSECVCPECGCKTDHKRGVPCVKCECPKCNCASMRGEFCK